MEALVAILVPLGSFAMVFGIVYLRISSIHREKMAMIEAGMDPGNYKDDRIRNPNRLIRYICLLILVPIGVLIGRSVNAGLELSPKHSALIFAFIFGGIALAISYIIEKRITEKDSVKEKSNLHKID